MTLIPCAWDCRKSWNLRASQICNLLGQELWITSGSICVRVICMVSYGELDWHGLVLYHACIGPNLEPNLLKVWQERLPRLYRQEGPQNSKRPSQKNSSSKNIKSLFEGVRAPQYAKLSKYDLHNSTHRNRTKQKHTPYSIPLKHQVPNSSASWDSTLPRELSWNG